MTGMRTLVEVRAAIARHRPRLNRRELIDRCAIAEHHLEIRTDAYERLLADNAHRGDRLDLADNLIGSILAMLDHPSTADPLGAGAGLALNIRAHVGAYHRALDEYELYHTALGDPDADGIVRRPEPKPGA